MNKTLLERHPFAATFVLIVISGVVAAIITANLSGIGGAVGYGLHQALPWLAAISGASGVLQVGPAQEMAPLPQLRVPPPKPQSRPADRAIAELDAMVGLARVKEE